MLDLVAWVTIGERMNDASPRTPPVGFRESPPLKRVHIRFSMPFIITVTNAR